ncbi:hypothetical protein C8R44DRAFT_735031 [Mycena epipterygia]|nr:hypothetical protein C8R44DRAFT_735031 [Mycena epipterygia]
MAAYSPALDGTLGAFEIGTAVGTFLFGILTLQTFNYYRQFPGDSMPFKIIVSRTWSYNLLSTSGKTYIMTVTFYGAPPSEHILQPSQSQIVMLLFSGVIDTMVQIFFGHRIRVLSGRPHFFLLSIVLAITRLTCDIVVTSSYWIELNLSVEAQILKEHWLVVTATALSPFCDIFIALPMCYCLWKVRNSEFTRFGGIAEIILLLTRKDSSTRQLGHVLELDAGSVYFPRFLNGRSRFRSSETTIPSLPLDFGSTKNHGEGNHILTDRVSGVRIVRSVTVDISPIPEAHNDRDEISSKVLLWVAIIWDFLTLGSRP